MRKPLQIPNRLSPRAKVRLAMREKEIAYEVVFQDEWQKRLNELLAEDCIRASRGFAQSTTGSDPSTIFTLLWTKYSFVSAFIMRSR